MNRGISAAIDGKTICALSTPAGMGGIAVVRVSGKDAIALACKTFSKDLTQVASHQAVFGRMKDSDGTVIDECIATVFLAPGTYTGEDTVEISVHGSTFIQSEAVRALLDAGCRHAGPGEFTARAFLNGKMDLTQAEAVGDLIASEHAGAHRLAMDQLRGGFAKEINALRTELIGFAGLLELELDFAEEDVEFADRERFDLLLGDLLERIGALADSFRKGNAIRDGIPVAILGAPNGGKSTLLNALLGDDRAIVSPTAGTTRDTIEDTCILGSTKFRFIDTAGLRATEDDIESEGIRRALEKARSAAMILYVLDASQDSAADAEQALTELQTADDTKIIAVWNKTDISSAPSLDAWPSIDISASQGTGLDALKKQLLDWGAHDTSNASVIITNLRHYEALMEARQSLQATRTGLSNDIPGDLVASDVRQALYHLGTITGAIDPEDILNHIFSNFCIGK
ncbi:MAG: tRNA uridine-5-carboxymethylaminomethyl(34) synthesis GTPase MnmE [Flavobacteriales bacterium]|nr:tRNA uridine-5-carboxymethylaminomethyl(34) synthesis GTPase MnmE [Flavobacteriales bacterium]